MWTFVREKVDNMLGYCDSPKEKNKKIVVDSRLKDKKELEIILHEMMHAAQWDLDEEVVAHVSEDFARVLWKLGYRKEEN